MAVKGAVPRGIVPIVGAKTGAPEWGSGLGLNHVDPFWDKAGCGVWYHGCLLGPETMEGPGVYRKSWRRIGRPLTRTGWGPEGEARPESAAEVVG